ncbi:MAG: ATP-dependent 6-phosphofructokinase [Ignavibacteriales bacterium]|nr:ATP-dependent 6-phosphofructokinase [Ignavibacteriales bacterium]MBI3787987.1 ATP-dependent 6-phosphofructokinase [Ignavibacteriales bacterium]
MNQLKRIGILTGGGDCPGLNAVIRSIAKPAMTYFGATVIGVQDGFEGLVEGRMRELTPKDIGGILNVGGTILGTSNKGDPFHFPVETPQGVEVLDYSQHAIRNYKDWELDCLIAIGGDGTMHIVDKFTDMGLHFVGVPKTIDNDLSATDVTFGYDSAVAVATDAIDRLHTTASAHHRVMVVEVMGRYAGWIALGAGLAGGADAILIPEIPFKWSKLYEHVLKRSKRGSRFSIICVAEGAKPAEGDIVVREQDKKRTDPIRLGGIGELVGEKVMEATGLETRITVLGHLQRGGSPTPYDRILATKYGSKALELAWQGKFGHMVSLRGTDVVSVPVKEAILKLRTVPIDSQLVLAAKAVGTSFGD